MSAKAPSSTAYSARLFIEELEKRGYAGASGVPCSYLKDLIIALEKSSKIRYVPAVREDAALGLATGMKLGGAKSLVMMQNSGLGYSLNVLTSLNMIFQIPVLVFISWRGYAGKDAPEHIIMGKSMQGVLDAVGMEHKEIKVENPIDALDWAENRMAATGQPCVLWVREGVFS